MYTVDFHIVRRQRPKDYVRIPLNPRLHIEEAPDVRYIEPGSGTEPMMNSAGYCRIRSMRYVYSADFGKAGL